MHTTARNTSALNSVDLAWSQPALWLDMNKQQITEMIQNSRIASYMQGLHVYPVSLFSFCITVRALVYLICISRGSLSFCLVFKHFNRGTMHRKFIILECLLAIELLSIVNLSIFNGPCQTTAWKIICFPLFIPET
jgi:hypothetical protein